MQFDHHNNQLIDHNNVWLGHVSSTHTHSADREAEGRREKDAGLKQEDSVSVCLDLSSLSLTSHQTLKERYISASQQSSKSDVFTSRTR